MSNVILGPRKEESVTTVIDRLTGKTLATINEKSIYCEPSITPSIKKEILDLLCIMGIIQNKYCIGSIEAI